MVYIRGELLEGFHIESTPQVNSDEEYSKDALAWVTGMRAIWLLYYTGKWEHLVALGMRKDTSLVEKLSAMKYGKRLTTKQAYSLAKRVPETELASVRLRMRYAIKFRMKEIVEKKEK